MNISTRKHRKGTTDTYLALIQEQPLKAIRTRGDYDEAAAMLDKLAIRDHLDAGEQQYLDAIEVLIEAYEDKVAPLVSDHRTPLQRLKYLMNTSGTSASQLRKILGASQPMVSMILAGHRAMSKKAIAKLGDHFNVEPGYFL